MKIFKALLTTLMLAAVLTSCGGNNNEDTATPSPVPTQTNDTMGSKMGDAAEDMADGAATQMNDMADTAKNVADDMTR